MVSKNKVGNLAGLISFQGYAGGDEAKMLRRHLAGSPVKVGIGADRRATAAWYFNKYGYVGSQSSISADNHRSEQVRNQLTKSEKIGAVILDDGMQVHHPLNY